MKICMHCLVSGLVQGVWFRAATQEQADELGLTGWVRNLPDGRVEVLACGEKEKLMQLQEWLKQGPPHARVDEMRREEVSWQEFTRFEIKP